MSPCSKTTALPSAIVSMRDIVNYIVQFYRQEILDLSDDPLGNITKNVKAHSWQRQFRVVVAANRWHDLFKSGALGQASVSVVTLKSAASVKSEVIYLLCW